MNITSLMARMAFPVFGKFGLSLTYKTSAEDFKALIAKIRPFKTDKDLIRLGPAADGGYLVPDDLEGIEACFSPGVGPSSGFEEDCSDRGMKVFLADGSVDGPKSSNRNLTFIKKYIGPVTKGNFITMDDWVKDSISRQDSDLLLQMDIEGWEYLSLLSTSNELLRRFRVIVVEFHNLARLWNSDFFRLASSAIDKLTINHDPIHMHINNYGGIEVLNGFEIPRMIEMTFLRKDRIRVKKIQTTLPHPLDVDSDVTKPKKNLPRFWYGLQQ